MSHQHQLLVFNKMLEQIFNVPPGVAMKDIDPVEHCKSCGQTIRRDSRYGPGDDGPYCPWCWPDRLKELAEEQEGFL